VYTVLKMITLKIEEIVNSDKFKNENQKIVISKGNYMPMDEFYNNTEYINIHFDIRGSKNPNIFEFKNTEHGIELNMVKKKIENTELVSFANSIQFVK